MINIISFDIRKIKMNSALSSLTQWEKELPYKHLLTPKLNSILSHIAQLTNYILFSIPSNPVVMVNFKQPLIATCESCLASPGTG